MSEIVLTDYPKPKFIRAHYRGVTTEKLVQMHKDLFHLMMCSMSEEAGGYVIDYDYKEVRKELEFRKAVPEGY